MTSQPEPQSDEVDRILNEYWSDRKNTNSSEGHAYRHAKRKLLAWGRKQRADAIKSYKKVSKLLEAELQGGKNE